MLKRVAKRLGLSRFIKLLKKILLRIRYIGISSYKVSDDLNLNLELISSLGIDIGEIKSILKSQYLDFYDNDLSWHYHLFAGLKQLYLNENKRIDSILEIGTHNGEFAHFLANLFTDAKIITIDLDCNNDQFKNSYNRKDDLYRQKFIKDRDHMLNLDNIVFKSMNSLNICSYFKESSFDLIWIDGDHLYPQVVIDIANCINLVKNNGIICTDDIVKDSNFIPNQYISNDSYKTLMHYKKNNGMRTEYLIKRITRNNYILKKYVSISFVDKNLISRSTRNANI